MRMRNFLVFLLLIVMFCSMVTAESVVLIGDSHSVGAYGQELHRLLVAQGDEVSTYAIGGSSVGTWVNGFDPSSRAATNTRKMQGADINVQPIPGSSVAARGVFVAGGTNVISLGTNNIATVHNGGSITRRVTELAGFAQAGGSRCVWVGPPVATRLCIDWKGGTCQERIEGDVLRSAIADTVAQIKSSLGSSCVFIDARDHTTVDDLSGDGIHFLAKGGKNWAREVVGMLDSSKKASRAVARVVDPSGVGGASVVEGSALVGGSSGIGSCTDRGRCKDIDEVWVSTGPLVRGSSQVWDFGVYRDFKDVYKESPTVTGSVRNTQSVQKAATGGVVSQPKPSGNIDERFVEAATRHNVRADVMKAISFYESGFRSDRIGPAGDAGYFQFIASTAKSKAYDGKPYYSNIVSCCEMSKTETRTSCREENAKTKGVWTQSLFSKGVYKCGPGTDDRFDVTKDIEAGARRVRTLLRNAQGVEYASDDDMYKVAIAGHHYPIIARWVKNAVKAGKIVEPVTWSDVKSVVLKEQGCYRSKGATYESILGYYAETTYSCAETLRTQGMGASCSRPKRVKEKC